MNKEKHLPSTLKNDENFSVKELAKELCEKSGCHHKCNDTSDCVVEDEALLLINENKSNNFDVKSNNEIGGLAKLISKTLCIECGQKPCEECKWYDENVERTDCTDCLIAEHLYNAGYRKQSEGEWEMFLLITSTYYGKQYYFLNKDGSVYSRASHSTMTRDEAIDEFLNIFRE